MPAMKIFAAAICIILSLVCALPVSAGAETFTLTYGMAGEEAYLCEYRTTSSSIFAIPPTYCARIISEEDGWYHVQYAEDDGLYRPKFGYVRCEKLTILSEPPATTYLRCPVTVTFTADSGGRTPLQPRVITAAYYGVYDDGGNIFSYLYDGEDFGYVTGDIGVYEPNTPSVPTVATPSAAPAAVNVKLIVALALTAVAAAALIILYFSGKRNPVQRRDNKQ